ncbi:MAG: hypothetical protein ACRCTK_02050, partial [Alphaproteobacteria bacterium]
MACFVSTLAWATAAFTVGENDKLALETTPEKRAERPLSDLEQQTSAIVGEILKSLSSEDKQNLKATSKALYDKMSAFATRINLKDRIPLDSPFFKNLNQFNNWVEVKFVQGDWSTRSETDKRTKLESFLDFLPNMTEIKSLDLKDYYEKDLLDVDVIRILAEKLPVGLERLNFKMRKIGDAGLEVLVAKLPASIKELNLYDVGIGARGVNALIAAFPTLPNLEKINLSFHLSGLPIENLAQALPKAQKLTDFILVGCKINDAGAAALQAALPKTHIKHLDL